MTSIRKCFCFAVLAVALALAVSPVTASAEGPSPSACPGIYLGQRLSEPRPDGKRYAVVVSGISPDGAHVTLDRYEMASRYYKYVERSCKEAQEYSAFYRSHAKEDPAE